MMLQRREWVVLTKFITPNKQAKVSRAESGDPRPSHLTPVPTRLFYLGCNGRHCPGPGHGALLPGTMVLKKGLGEVRVESSRAQEAHNTAMLRIAWACLHQPCPSQHFMAIVATGLGNSQVPSKSVPSSATTVDRHSKPGCVLLSLAWRAVFPAHPAPWSLRSIRAQEPPQLCI